VKVASTVRGEEVRKGLSSDTTWKIQAGLRKQRYLAGPLPYLICTTASHAGADDMDTIMSKPVGQSGRVILPRHGSGEEKSLENTSCRHQGHSTNALHTSQSATPVQKWQGSTEAQQVRNVLCATLL
jgi:hypothetical protein